MEGHMDEISYYRELYASLWSNILSFNKISFADNPKYFLNLLHLSESSLSDYFKIIPTRNHLGWSPNSEKEDIENTSIIPDEFYSTKKQGSLKESEWIEFISALLANLYIANGTNQASQATQAPSEKYFLVGDRNLLARFLQQVHQIASRESQLIINSQNQQNASLAGSKSEASNNPKLSSADVNIDRKPQNQEKLIACNLQIHNWNLVPVTMESWSETIQKLFHKISLLDVLSGQQNYQVFVVSQKFESSFSGEEDDSFSVLTQILDSLPEDVAHRIKITYISTDVNLHWTPEIDSKQIVQSFLNLLKQQQYHLFGAKNLELLGWNQAVIYQKNHESQFHHRFEFINSNYNQTRTNQPNLSFSLGSTPLKVLSQQFERVSICLPSYDLSVLQNICDLITQNDDCRTVFSELISFLELDVDDESQISFTQKLKLLSWSQLLDLLRVLNASAINSAYGISEESLTNLKLWQRYLNQRIHLLSTFPKENFLFFEDAFNLTTLTESSLLGSIKELLENSPNSYLVILDQDENSDDEYVKLQAISALNHIFNLQLGFAESELSKTEYKFIRVKDLIASKQNSIQDTNYIPCLTISEYLELISTYKCSVNNLMIVKPNFDTRWNSVNNAFKAKSYLDKDTKYSRAENIFVLQLSDFKLDVQEFICTTRGLLKENLSSCQETYDNIIWSNNLNLISFIESDFNVKALTNRVELNWHREFVKRFSLADLRTSLMPQGNESSLIQPLVSHDFIRESIHFKVVRLILELSKSPDLYKFVFEHLQKYREHEFKSEDQQSEDKITKVLSASESINWLKVVSLVNHIFPEFEKAEIDASNPSVLLEFLNFFWIPIHEKLINVYCINHLCSSVILGEMNLTQAQEIIYSRLTTLDSRGLRLAQSCFTDEELAWASKIQIALGTELAYLLQDENLEVLNYRSLDYLDLVFINAETHQVVGIVIDDSSTVNLQDLLNYVQNLIFYNQLGIISNPQISLGSSACVNNSLVSWASKERKATLTLVNNLPAGLKPEDRCVEFNKLKKQVSSYFLGHLYAHKKTSKHDFFHDHNFTSYCWEKFDGYRNHIASLKPNDIGEKLIERNVKSQIAVDVLSNKDINELIEAKLLTSKIFTQGYLKQSYGVVPAKQLSKTQIRISVQNLFADEMGSHQELKSKVRSEILRQRKLKYTAFIEFEPILYLEKLNLLCTLEQYKICEKPFIEKQLSSLENGYKLYFVNSNPSLRKFIFIEEQIRISEAKSQDNKQSLEIFNELERFITPYKNLCKTYMHRLGDWCNTKISKFLKTEKLPKLGFNKPTDDKNLESCKSTDSFNNNSNPTAYRFNAFDDKRIVTSYEFSKYSLIKTLELFKAVSKLNLNFKHIPQPALLLATDDFGVRELKGMGNVFTPSIDHEPKTTYEVYDTTKTSSSYWTSSTTLVEDELLDRYWNQEDDYLGDNFHLKKLNQSLIQHEPMSESGSLKVKTNILLALLQTEEVQGFYKLLVFCYFYAFASYSKQISMHNKHFYAHLQDAYLNPEVLFNKFWIAAGANLQQTMSSQDSIEVVGNESLKVYLTHMGTINMLMVDFAKMRLLEDDLHLSGFEEEFEANEVLIIARIYYLYCRKIIDYSESLSDALQNKLSWEFLTPVSGINLTELYLKTFSRYRLSAFEEEFLKLTQKNLYNSLNQMTEQHLSVILDT